MISGLFNDAVNLMMNNEVFRGGIGIGVATYSIHLILPFLNGVVSRIKRRIIFNVTIDGSETAGYRLIRGLELWLDRRRSNKSKRLSYSLVDIDFIKSGDEGNLVEVGNARKINPFVSGIRKSYSLLKRYWNDRFFIFYRGRILKFVKSIERLEHASSINDSVREEMNISGLFSQRAILSIIEDAKKLFEDELAEFEMRKHECNLYIAQSSGYASEFGKVPNKTFDNIYFEHKDAIVRDLDMFISESERYDRLGIPMKRVYCLEGPPGTGKTSTSFAIANHIKKDLYTINLSVFSSDSSLIHMLEEVPEGSIISWEDIDSVMIGRLNKDEPDKTNVSFSTILNILDGSLSSRRFIHVITTNHLEAFDSALLRKGRIDKIITMGLPKVRDVLEFILSFYFEKDIYKHRFDEFIIENKEVANQEMQEPMSHYQDLILQNKDFRDILEKFKGEIAEQWEKKESKSKEEINHFNMMTGNLVNMMDAQ